MSEMHTPSKSDIFELHERRSEWRVELGLPCLALVRGQRRRCTLIDVSCAGAAIAYDTGEPPDGVHTVKLATRGGSLHALARTAWRDGARHGVSFLGLDAAGRMRIAEAIDGMLAARRGLAGVA